MNSEASDWYALQVQSRLASIASTTLRGKGYEEYLPVYRSRRRWSDRINTDERRWVTRVLSALICVNRRLDFLLAPALLAETTAFAASPPTFNRDVLPILQKHCQICHRPGEVAPMPLLTYRDARPWAKAIKTQVAARKVPPWFADPAYGHFQNERGLSEQDVRTIETWVEAARPKAKLKTGPLQSRGATAGTSGPTPFSRCRIPTPSRPRGRSTTYTL
jgi:mono/diheme cytochrome c family protein